jgi:hypothetical protein
MSAFDQAGWQGIHLRHALRHRGDRFIHDDIP